MTALPNASLSRRSLLGAVGAAVGLTALAACSDGTAGTGTAASRRLTLPTHLSPSAVPGQTAGTDPSVPVAFAQYPVPYQTVAEPPGAGGTVSTFQVSYTAPPPSNNRYLTELNKRLNVTLKPTLVSPSDLGQKTATLIAGGDMPDLFYLNVATGQAPAAAQSVLQGAFTDLTEYLSGDAITDYPNLAQFPTYAWENSAIQARLYGVPRPEPLLQSGNPTMRLDWMRQLGLAAPSNADELFQLFSGFTNAAKGTWALSSLQIYWQNTPILNMFGVPNNWRADSAGKLVKDIETDEFEASLEYTIKLWKAGVFHPNSAASTYDQQTALWNSGKIGVWGGALSGAYAKPIPAVAGVSDWTTDLGPLIPPGHTGGTAALYQSSGTFGMFAIPSAVGKDKDRLRELLRILNYVGAPFGSIENTFLTYGVEGWNYTMENGTPTRSADAARKAELAAQYFCEPTETVLYVPTATGRALEAQKVAEKLVPHTVADPTVNLVSQTQVTKGPSLQQDLNDQFVGIVTGRKPLSALKDMRSQWANRGGDQIRRELEQSLAKSR